MKTGPTLYWKMKASFPQSLKERHHRSAIAGFSMIEVILAIGLLAFGVGIALRLLSGSLESLKAARAANTALDLVPVIEAKLSQPGIDHPPALNVQSQDSLKRRFFNQVFTSIKKNEAIQLLVYPYDSGSGNQNDRNALGARFSPIPGLGGDSLQSFCSSNLATLVSDAPDQLFRIVLSASPANEERLIFTKKATNPAAFEPERIPSFVEYDVKSGGLPSESSSQTLDICQIQTTNSGETGDSYSSIVIRVHIFRQGFPFSPGANADTDELNKNLQINNLAFTFDTILLAY